MDLPEVKQEIQIIEREVTVYETVHEKMLRLLHCEVDQMIMHISRLTELEALPTSSEHNDQIVRTSTALTRTQDRISWLLETLILLERLQEVQDE
jgi:hypothetical protein